MKSISDVVSILLMLVITIGIIGFAYTYISGVFSSRTSFIIEFVTSNNGEIIIRNVGTQPLPVSNIEVFVAASPERKVRIKSDKDPIPPGQIATLTILDSYEFEGRKRVTIKAPGTVLGIVGDFGINSPTGNSTWFAKTGKHTGYGINYCGWNCEDWVNVSIDNSWRWLPGLVAWYRFDEGYGSKAMDETLRNNGTLVNGPIWVDGKVGKALSFDGIDDYVNIPSNVYSDDMTVVLWVKPHVINDGYYHGFFGYQGASTYYRPFNLWVAPSNGGLHWWISKSDNSQYHAGTISNFFTEPNTWYHIAFVKSGNKLTIYKNGNPITLPDSPFTDLYKPSTLWIGRIDNYFNGIIDEVMIFNRALSEEEIRLLYEQGAGKFSSPASFDASSCPIKVYAGYPTCCMCEDSARNCNGCEITTWFKKYITVPSNVGKVMLGFSTDDPIRVYVNGQLAYERGCCCNPCSPIDLTPYVKKGTTNVITVKFMEGCWCGYFGGTLWYE